MNVQEAHDWLSGKLSMLNVIPQDPFETWQVRVAQADAAMMQQAFYIAKFNGPDLSGIIQELLDKAKIDSEIAKHEGSAQRHWHEGKAQGLETAAFIIKRRLA